MRPPRPVVACLVALLLAGPAVGTSGATPLDQAVAASNAFWDRFLPDTCPGGVPVTFDAPAPLLGRARLDLWSGDGRCPIELEPSLAVAPAHDLCLITVHEIGHWRLYLTSGFTGHLEDGVMSTVKMVSTPECDRLGPPAVSRRKHPKRARGVSHRPRHRTERAAPRS